MSKPITAAGGDLLQDHLDGMSISEHAPEDDPCWLESQIALIEKQAITAYRQAELRWQEEDRL